MSYLFKNRKDQIISVNANVKIINRRGQINILCHKLPFMRYYEKDLASEKVAIIQLYRTRLAEQKQLARAFGIHPNTVNNLIRSYHKVKDLSFLQKKRGPKDNYSLTPRVKRVIYEEISLSQGKLSENELAHLVSQRIGEDISRASISKALIEGGFKNSLDDDSSSQLELTFEEESDPNQLEFNFTWNSDNRSLNGKSKPNFTQRNNNSDQKSLMLTRVDQFYLKRLSKGCICQYGGILIYNHLIEKLQFGSVMEEYLSSLNTRQINSKEICYSLLYGALLEVRSIGAFDRFFKKDFGILLGKPISFSGKTYRKFFDDMSSLNKTEEIMLSFAQRFLECKIVQIGVFYFDGHFIPYHGLENLTKGFYTTIRLAMKGNLHYFVNDKSGSPLFFMLKEAQVDLIRIIPELIAKTRQIIKEYTPKVKPLKICFDRGGWSAPFFKELDTKYQVLFYTWRKNVPLGINEIPEEEFKACLVKLKFEKMIVKYLDETIFLKDYGKIRSISIIHPKSKKRSPILTNDFSSQAKEPVQIMFSRWNQDNFFKTMKERYHLDYFPGYDIEELENQPLVKNPKLLGAKRAKKKLQVELAKKRKTLVTRFTTKKRNAISLAEYKQKQAALINEMKILKERIAQINKEMEKLPPRISALEVYSKRRFSICDFEKKRFFDLIRIVAHNIEQEMTKAFSSYYTRKDCYQVMRMIPERTTEVKLVNNDTLLVKIKDLGTDRMNQIAQRFLTEINNIGGRTLDKFQLKLLFDVEFEE
ncbi:hypothetical protein ES702_00012 [subsurface metagenome]